MGLRGPKPTTANMKGEFAAMRESGMTMAEIGRRFGLSRQRIEQILSPEKHKARQSARLAKRDGQLQVSDNCQSCGRTLRRLYMHHVDYSRPLEVTWLCGRCHGKAEHRLRNVPKARESKFVCRQMRDRRLSLNMSMIELSIASAVSLPVVSYIETKSVMPKLDQGIALAAALRVSAETFASWFSRKPRAQVKYGAKRLHSRDNHRRWLSEMRIARGMSQAKLAELIGASKISVCLWEAGVHRPGEKFMSALADVFDIPIPGLEKSFDIDCNATQQAA